MALTTRQIAFSNPSKATRQQIPPFLSKLYHMVNDPSTESLIRWSDSGDSFYVFDHERFAKEVLPHWFKHGNFGSFVRQLNNYGFHKVPHLQQGVLRSDGEAEISHFENQYFQRGQSDLLCLIQRKRQGHDTGDDPPDATPPSSSSGQANNKTETEPPPPNPTTPKGTVLDASSILNGIQAIKRHQHAISAELKELHQSNQTLWQEAYAARERHKKHHDTITRILKFLAGVFGQNTASPRAQEVPHENSGDGSAIIGRRSNRLMIEAAGKKTGDAISNGLKLNINDFMESLDFEGGQANDGDRFSTVETTGSRGASPAPSTAKESAVMGDVHSPALSAIPSSTVVAKTPIPTPLTPTINNSTNNGDNDSSSNNLFYSFPAVNVNQNQLNRNDFPEIFSPHFTTASTTNPTTLNTNTNDANNINTNDANNINNNSTALTCSTPPIPSAPGNDPNYLQNALAALLSNPAQLQRVLTTLQIQVPMTIPSEAGSNGSNEAIGTPGSSLNTRPELLSPMISDFRSLSDNNQFGPTISLLDVPSNLGILSHGADDGTLSALAQSSQQLQKSYKDTKEVEEDVNMLQGHIDSLIESLGLDTATNAMLRGDHMDEIVGSNASQANGLGMPTTSANATTRAGGTAAAPPPPPPPPFSESSNADFDFDSFLTQDFHSGNGFGFGQGFELNPAAQTQGSENIGAFLDEVQSVSNESDITAPDEAQQDKGRAGVRKRRSDAVELEDSKGTAGPKVKRKR